jgi:FkbM family methyltransferase
MKFITSLKIRILKIFKKNRGYFLIDKTKMFLDYLDPIDRELIENHKYEEKEINFLLNCIRKNNIKYFIDIGANCGYYSTKLTVANKNLKIIAFEPNKEAYYKFKKTLKINPIFAHQIKLNNFGLSNYSKKLEMTSLEKFSYLQTGGSTIINSNEKKSINTKIFKANFVKGDEEINLKNENLCLKIDIEGHEYEALKGLENTLKKNKVILQVEIVNQNFQKVNNLLNSFGYKFFNKIVGRGDWIHNYYYKNFKL